MLESKTWGYKSYRDHLAERFPGMVIRKCCLNAGFSCPNLDGTVARGGCTYCNNQGFVPGDLGQKKLISQWHRGRAALRRRYRRVDGFIAYFQAYSNTHRPLHELVDLYDDIPEVLEECVGMSISTRPDCLDREKINYFDDLGKKTFLTMEMGLQSDRDECLALTNRGHDTRAFFETLELMGAKSFDICVHVILGLPKEGADAPERMGRLLSTLPIQSVKVHNLHIMSGTSMAQSFKRGELRAMEREEYLSGVTRLIQELRPDQCCQRVLADAPDHTLLSGRWCQKKQDFLPELKAMLSKNGDVDEVLESTSHGESRCAPYRAEKKVVSY